MYSIMTPQSCQYIFSDKHEFCKSEVLTSGPAELCPRGTSGGTSVWDGAAEAWHRREDPGVSVRLWQSVEAKTSMLWISMLASRVWNTARSGG